MSEENIPEVNNTPDVVEEPKGAFKELVESVSDLAGKAGEIVEDAVKTVAEEIKETVLGPEEKAEEEKVEEKKVEEENDAVGEHAGDAVDLGSLTLAELSDMFDKLSQDENRMRRYKEAEAIKSAFYKRLSKEKAEAGLGSKVDEPSSRVSILYESISTSSNTLNGNGLFNVGRFLDRNLR